MSKFEKLGTVFMTVIVSSVGWAQEEPETTPPIPPIPPSAPLDTPKPAPSVPREAMALESLEVDQPVDVRAMTARQRKLVQQALAEDRVYEGDIDGKFGKQTWAAIRAFQEQHALSVNNGLTSRTLELLGLRDLPVSVVSGTFTSKDVVREVQQLLRIQDYQVKQIDGILGPATRLALKQFQRDQGLAPSGQLDELTLQRLGVRESDFESSGPSSAPVPEKVEVPPLDLERSPFESP
ncbi:MAG: peptidoglycan-binding protein [Deltaproteobacteria bacterium]|nr:peptidoglycan-binding protein [Deltaproteobacteria bacterium]